MVQTTEKSYLNTLVFTIVAEGISVLIIGLLAFDIIRPYAPFLFTVEVGLIFIIIWTLYAIRRYQAKMENQFKILSETRVTNVPCPDYYVRDADPEGNLICKNEYVTPDGRILYKFINKEVNGQKQDNSDIAQIAMKDLFSDRKLQEVCNDELSKEGKYGNIPWTAIKTSCPNLDDYDDYEEYYKSNIYQRLE